MQKSWEPPERAPFLPACYLLVSDTESRTLWAKRDRVICTARTPAIGALALHFLEAFSLYSQPSQQSGPNNFCNGASIIPGDDSWCVVRLLHVVAPRFRKTKRSGLALNEKDLRWPQNDDWQNREHVNHPKKSFKLRDVTRKETENLNRYYGYPRRAKGWKQTPLHEKYLRRKVWS